LHAVCGSVERSVDTPLIVDRPFAVLKLAFRRNGDSLSLENSNVHHRGPSSNKKQMDKLDQVIPLLPCDDDISGERDETTTKDVF
jgi:hypothetical protein